jgi:fatty acid desaturase
MFYVSTLSLFVIKSALKLINAAQAITMSGNYTFYVHFHITHHNTCSALYRIGQYVYFSKLIADKCWFLNYLLPGGVVLIDQGFTIYDLSTLSLFVIKSALKLINAAQAITMSGNYTFYVHFNTCNSSSCCYILRGNWSFFFNKWNNDNVET